MLEAVWHVSMELGFLVLVLPLISPATLHKFLNLFYSMFGYNCINHVSSFYKFDALTSAPHAYAGHALLWTTPNRPYCGSCLPHSFPGPLRKSLPIMLFQYKPAKTECTSQAISFIRVLPSGQLHTCPDDPRNGHQTRRDSSHAPEPTNIMQPSQS